MNTLNKLCHVEKVAASMIHLVTMLCTLLPLLFTDHRQSHDWPRGTSSISTNHYLHCHFLILSVYSSSSLRIEHVPLSAHVDVLVHLRSNTCLQTISPWIHPRCLVSLSQSWRTQLPLVDQLQPLVLMKSQAGSVVKIAGNSNPTLCKA